MNKEQNRCVSTLCFHGAFCRLAQQRFEFGEDLLDRVQVWAVGRQEEEFCASVADGFAHGLAFVAAEIVQDDDIAWFQGWNQELLDIGRKLRPLMGPSMTQGAVILSPQSAPERSGFSSVHAAPLPATVGRGGTVHAYGSCWSWPMSHR